MALGPDDLLRLLGLNPGKPMDRGMLRNARVRAADNPAQAAFVDRLLETPAAAGVDAVRHPAELVKRLVARAPFSASDVAWLSRIPSDPAEIDEETAKELATLARQAVPGSGDERLIKSIWAPVNEHYSEVVTSAQRKAAEAASAPPPAWVGEAVRPLVAEAFAAAGSSDAQALASAKVRVRLDEVTANRAAAARPATEKADAALVRLGIKSKDDLGGDAA